MSDVRQAIGERYCQRCKAIRPHEARSTINTVTNAATTAEYCLGCNQTATSHEAPLEDAPPLSALGLPPRQRLRLVFVRYEYAHGLLSEETV